MTGISVRTTHLTQTFDELNALDGVTLEIRPGTITGLLGRNGAGKSTLLSIVAGLQRPTSGEVLVDGEDPFENALAAADTQLMRESGDGFATEPVSSTLSQYRDRRENWSAELAGQLIDTFELNVKQKLESLSRGQASMVGAIIGLAARAPLTIFDETYLEKGDGLRARGLDRGDGRLGILGAGRAVIVDHDGLCALRREIPRQQAAKVLGSACDQGNFVLKGSICHGTLLILRCRGNLRSGNGS